MSSSRQVVAFGKVGAAIAASLREVIESDKRALAIAASEWPLRFELAAKAHYPATGLKRVSGHLWGSIEGFSRMSGGKLVVGLRNKMRYAWYHEYGSKKHKITAKGKALRFKGRGGKFVFAKSVNHPGTKARRFLRTPLQRTAPRLIKALKDEIGFKG